MSSGIVKTALVLFILFTAFAVGSNAQRARAKVDFDFRIGDRLYPAGTYDLEETNPSNPGVLRIGMPGTGDARLAVAWRHRSEDAMPPMLVFERFSGVYFLKVAFLKHSSRGYAFKIPKGRPEGRLAVAVTDGRPAAKGN